MGWILGFIGDEAGYKPRILWKPPRRPPGIGYSPGGARGPSLAELIKKLFKDFFKYGKDFLPKNPKKPQPPPANPPNPVDDDDDIEEPPIEGDPFAGNPPDPAKVGPGFGIKAIIGMTRIDGLAMEWRFGDNDGHFFSTPLTDWYFTIISAQSQVMVERCTSYSNADGFFGKITLVNDTIPEDTAKKNSNKLKAIWLIGWEYQYLPPPAPIAFKPPKPAPSPDRITYPPIPIPKPLPPLDPEPPPPEPEPEPKKTPPVFPGRPPRPYFPPDLDPNKNPNPNPDTFPPVNPDYPPERRKAPPIPYPLPDNPTKPQPFPPPNPYFPPQIYPPGIDPTPDIGRKPNPPIPKPKPFPPIPIPNPDMPPTPTPINPPIPSPLPTPTPTGPGNPTPTDPCKNADPCQGNINKNVNDLLLDLSDILGLLADLKGLLEDGFGQGDRDVLNDIDQKLGDKYESTIEELIEATNDNLKELAKMELINMASLFHNAWHLAKEIEVHIPEIHTALNASYNETLQGLDGQPLLLADEGDQDVEELISESVGQQVYDEMEEEWQESSRLAILGSNLIYNTELGFRSLSNNVGAASTIAADIFNALRAIGKISKETHEEPVNANYPETPLQNKLTQAIEGNAGFVDSDQFSSYLVDDMKTIVDLRISAETIDTPIEEEEDPDVGNSPVEDSPNIEEIDHYNPNE